VPLHVHVNLPCASSASQRHGLRASSFMDGVAKAVGGLTTIEEVYRNVVVDG
jgi:hypothetical protein